MRINRTASLFLLLAVPAMAQTTNGWKLVWSDEFNALAGTPPDATKWNYDLGNNSGWGNGEAEVYTNSPNNVSDLKLVWSDEFNALAGTPPDATKWNYDLGNNSGWGNGEAEVYTNSPNNV